MSRHARGGAPRRSNRHAERHTRRKAAREEELAEDADIRAKYGPREGLSEGGAGDPRAIDTEGHRRQFEDFVTAIQRGERPLCDGEQGRHAVAIITSIYESAREGRLVRVP